MKIFLCGVIDLVCRVFDESVYVDVKKIILFQIFQNIKSWILKYDFLKCNTKKKTSYVVKMKINIII